MRPNTLAGLSLQRRAVPDPGSGPEAAGVAVGARAAALLRRAAPSWGRCPDGEVRARDAPGGPRGRGARGGARAATSPSWCGCSGRRRQERVPLTVEEVTCAAEGDARRPAVRDVRGVRAARDAAQRGARAAVGRRRPGAGVPAGAARAAARRRQLWCSRRRRRGRGGRFRCPPLVVESCEDHRVASGRRAAGSWRSGGRSRVSSSRPRSGRRSTRDNCTGSCRRRAEQAGVRVVRLHDFRHGCVSVLLGLGVPPRTAMEIAGHSTIEMTMNVYGHVTLGRQAGGAGQARRPVRGGEMTALQSPVAVT